MTEVNDKGERIKLTMLVPISWLKDYVEIDIPVELLAERLTVAGLEVTHIKYIGLPQQSVPDVRMPSSDHLVWDREKLLLGRIVEVRSHPQADRLVLALVDYGDAELEQCVTGATNLFAHKDQGEINPPIWSAFAKEGATVWDGHSDKPRQMTLKGKELRGIFNKSMVCSEKELGISEEHEGVIVMDHDDAYVAGTPLADVLGDVVLDIEFTPNLARCFSIVGVAREVAALLDVDMRYPSFDFLAEGASIEGQVGIDIREPELNPRFSLTLLRDTEVKPSPFWMQHRLKLIGQRPRNNIVDVTNYITFELGQPLHAFDYDKLVERALGVPPTIITRLPGSGEQLETLDGALRALGAETILVADRAGALSLGGVIGGGETEISETTRNVLLEAAAWNNIGIRKTIKEQRVHTEASARFSRGVHPSQAILGCKRGIELMRQLGSGQVADGVLDAYPKPPATVTVDLPIERVSRLLGMEVALDQAADVLRRLEFEVEVNGDMIRATAPDHRLDISSDEVVGQADLLEEIARIIGYDRIPESIMADEMPPQRENTAVMIEERIRDILVEQGMYEVISYRFTSRESEAMLVPKDAAPSRNADYVEIVNPAASERDVLRQTLMINMLESAVNSARYQSSQQIFEVGKVYLGRGDILPEEPVHLGILLTGARREPWWQGGGPAQNMDFYDLKGVLESLLAGLHIEDYSFERGTHCSYHPGRSADLLIGGQRIGSFGEIHPEVTARFKLPDAKVIYGEIEVTPLIRHHQRLHKITPLPTTPAVLEDIALIVSAGIAAGEVEAVIRQAGGRLLREVTLFDVYTGDPIPPGKKSLAYSLTYQDENRTLTDKNAAKIRKKIIGAARHRLNAELRS